MSQKNNNLKFNTDSLLDDLNKVIQNGVNNLLNDYIANYKLYEETHNCIMNLPSVRREINKRNVPDDDYADMPDLISISSEDDTSDHYYSKYSKIPLESDTDEESDDTILCMRKVANQLLQKKEETIALYQEEEKSYKEIIENRNKEIEDLKNRINIILEDNNKKYTLFYKQKELYENALEKCNKEIVDLKNLINIYVKQPVVCDLACGLTAVDIEPRQEVVVEIKQEKENIILHIEENSEQDGEVQESESEDEEQDDESEEEDDESEEEDDEVVEELDDEEDEEAAEDEVAIEEEECDEADEEEDEADEELDDEEDEEAAEDEVAIEDEEVDEEKVEDAEVSDAEDTVETEKSDSDEESQEEIQENTEVVKDEEEEEEELIEIEIDDVTYCTENDENGFIYELDNDGNVGEAVG